MEKEVIQEAQIYPNSGNPQAGRIYSADGLSPTIDTCEGGNRMPKVIEPLKIKEATDKGYAEAYDGDSVNISFPDSNTRRGRVGRGCAQTLQTNCEQGVVLGNNNSYRIRKLTPRECFRLMGVKDKDFNKIAKNQSDSSLYHLAGDSIVTNVLQAIFKNMT